MLSLQLQAPPTDLTRAVNLTNGLFVCGDHRDTATLDGALKSGRRAARGCAGSHSSTACEQQRGCWDYSVARELSCGQSKTSVHAIGSCMRVCKRAASVLLPVRIAMFSFLAASWQACQTGRLLATQGAPCVTHVT